MTTTAEFIAGFEGFGKRAYWDVNAWRLGFGSDTEGPDQIRVTQGMQTTRERALQNLAARIPEFQRIAIHAMGEEAWDALNEAQRTAITSIVYNYGRLPIHVDPSDPAKTADEIRALQTHNSGINRKRRLAEAEFYLRGEATYQVPESQPPTIPAPPPVPQVPAGAAGRNAAVRASIGASIDALEAEKARIDAEIKILKTAGEELARIDSDVPIFSTSIGDTTMPIPMNQTKPALASTSVWGGLIAAAGPLIDWGLSSMGHSSDPRISMAAGVLGGLMAIFGRVNANTQISGIIKSK
jgi:GH24 family phage-related lysozyme (muramidase)